MIHSFLHYCLAARDEHALHSPFLFDLYTRTIRADTPQGEAFGPIVAQRKQLRNSNKTIHVTDYGTGAGRYDRTVGSIARKSLKSDKIGRLLYRLVGRFGAKTVLDMGTSLGITTAYLAHATNRVGGTVLTFEGCPETAAVAGDTFQQLGCRNVRQIVGNLDETLAETLATVRTVDLAFFDANHRYSPTIHYFTICLDHIHNDSVFIFDDIHWSTDMERAWETIKAHPAVTMTVDLFQVGLVFFRREQPKQHFVLRF